MEAVRTQRWSDICERREGRKNCMERTSDHIVVLSKSFGQKWGVPKQRFPVRRVLSCMGWANTNTPIIPSHWLGATQRSGPFCELSGESIGKGCQPLSQQHVRLKEI